MSDSAPVAVDAPQTFAPATSYQVRDELVELLRRDLLGPWGGEQERFAPKAQGPRDRYLVGLLGPRRLVTDPLQAADTQPDELGAEADGQDGELPDQLTVQNAGRMWASSMGLSFTVTEDVGAVAVTAAWARYVKTEVESPDGKPSRVWAREPLSTEREVRLDGPAGQRLPLSGQPCGQPGIELDVQVRPCTRPDGGRARVVEITLINNQDEPDRNKDTAWIFQSRLLVRALDGAAAIFQPVDDPLEDPTATGADEEDKHLRLLYRDQLRHAWGRNVAVHASVRPDERCAYELRTEWLPTYDVPSTEPSTSAPELAALTLSMDNLADLAAADRIEQLTAGLRPLSRGYGAWLSQRERDAEQLPGPLASTAQAAVARARDIARRIGAGIDLLASDGTAREAFAFANRAMALQRRAGLIAQERERTGDGYAAARAAVERDAVCSWRPFQLAFLLLNLPAITDPTAPERAADSSALVDLLFFPTGGGKTEAYLGLAAYTFAIRRLQGVLGSGADARSGEAGVAVLMRYTLRLLTAQQFQRAAALVCAAEVLRRAAYEAGDTRWGTTPFRIGLWVGVAVSPNFFDEAADEVAKARDAGGGQGARVLQTLACPWCGERLVAARDLEPDSELRRMLLYCPRGEPGPDGEEPCPFSKVAARSEGLPILTVDEEIYRLAPALLVATVDKLAQLPWRGYAGMLFGRVHRRCPRHGYRHDDLDRRTGCRATHHSKGRYPAVSTEPVVRLRPPDLIIQDELHLISGALGTVVGLFEAAVDELCTWTVSRPDGQPHLAGPKIVASTATTRRAADQVRGVFARQLAIFPPQVLDVSDTFFAHQVPVSPQHPGRRYLGVCAHGVRLKSAEIRIAEILLLAGQTLFDRYADAADPYLTMVGYFNSVRELAGMRRYLDDDIATRVRRNGRRRGLSDRLPTATGLLNVQELTSRISSADIADVLGRLGIRFDPEVDTTARKVARAGEVRLARREKREPRMTQRPFDRTPYDVVLATSMLQVGVDVPRLGLMTITGQPKNTAEYIQASSRVGRTAAAPGLVVTMYNWARPRDLAHYEDFETYHASFYRQVEALSVTPFARRALDRGAAGTVVAAVRNTDERYSRNTDAADVDFDAPVVAAVFRRMLQRAEHAGRSRGREYLAERLAVLRDAWEQAKSGSTRLGYEREASIKRPLRGLLQPAGGSGWTDLTVAQSMREAEHEINLLVGADVFRGPVGAPAWTFGSSKGEGEDAGDDADADGDELGELVSDTSRGLR